MDTNFLPVYADVITLFVFKKIHSLTKYRCEINIAI